MIHITCTCTKGTGPPHAYMAEPEPAVAAFHGCIQGKHSIILVLGHQLVHQHLAVIILT